MDSQPWVLRVLIQGPTPVPADWLAGHLAPVLAPYFELSSRFARVEVPIKAVDLATDEKPYNSAITDGLFNGADVADPTTALFFTAFTWVLDETQPVVRTTAARGVVDAPNNVRRIYNKVGQHLGGVIFGDATASASTGDWAGDWAPSRTGFYSNLIIIKQGEPLGPPLGEIPVPPEERRGGGWGWWLAGGALALLAGWAVFGGKRRGKARRLT